MNERFTNGLKMAKAFFLLLNIIFYYYLHEIRCILHMQWFGSFSTIFLFDSFGKHTHTHTHIFQTVGVVFGAAWEFKVQSSKCNRFGRLLFGVNFECIFF